MDLEINQKYKADGGGSTYTPLEFSPCKRWVYAKIETIEGKIRYRWFWSIARQFKNKIS